ncbi:MAG TPA: hypothetical protein VKT99_25405 [Xanthobacteraceae bacterium]|nr:hypothetical protein [Xanthobacteraceae bacterium]
MVWGLTVCGLMVAGDPALAQMQKTNQRTSPSQQPSPSQQLSTANQGTAARNHVFDGTRAPVPPVSANPGPKPSVVGVPTSQFKPTVHIAPAKPPPVPRRLNPTGDPDVQRGIDSYRRPGT